MSEAVALTYYSSYLFAFESTVHFFIAQNEVFS